jgi:hypothetical protein
MPNSGAKRLIEKKRKVMGKNVPSGYMCRHYNADVKTV